MKILNTVYHFIIYLFIHNTIPTLNLYKKANIRVTKEKNRSFTSITADKRESLIQKTMWLL